MGLLVFVLDEWKIFFWRQSLGMYCRGSEYLMPVDPSRYSDELLMTKILLGPRQSLRNGRYRSWCWRYCYREEVCCCQGVYAFMDMRWWCRWRCCCLCFDVMMQWKVLLLLCVDDDANVAKLKMRRTRMRRNEKGCVMIGPRLPWSQTAAQHLNKQLLVVAYDLPNKLVTIQPYYYYDIHAALYETECIGH